MDKRIRGVLTELRQRLQRMYADRLVNVLLYGSHSRGDATEGSDVDVLVVLSGPVNAPAEISRTIEDVSDISLQNDLAINCIFISQDEFEHGQSPLLLNIRREGSPAVRSADWLCGGIHSIGQKHLGPRM